MPANNADKVQHHSISICIVAGNVHSGTTIASMLIGQHPAAFISGALKRFPNGKQLNPTNTCTCGQHPLSCEIWSDVINKTRIKPDGPDVPADKLYPAIAQASGHKIIVDCTHNADRLKQLSQEVAGNPDLDLSVILISRSALEIADIQIRTSLRKRRINTGPLQRLKVITRGILIRRELRRTAQRLRSQIPVIEIDYHALCSDPTRHLGQAWRGMGLSSEKAHLVIEDNHLSVRKPPHMIQGNSRLRSQKEISLYAHGKNIRNLHLHEKIYAAALNGLTAVLPLPSVRSIRQFFGHER